MTPPQELADKNHRLIVEDLVGLGVSYDLYTRTTTRNHHAVVQELFLGVYENGYFVEQTTYGAISPSTGRTLPDRYIEGTCPICGYDAPGGATSATTAATSSTPTTSSTRARRSTARRRSSSRPSTSSSTCRRSPTR